MSLKTKMMLVFSVVVSVGLILVSAVSYFYTERLLTASINFESDSLVESQVNKLEDWLQNKTNTMQITANTVRKVTGEKEIPPEYLSGYAELDKEILTVYIGTTEGKTLDGSGWVAPADYDPRTRDWYKDAMAKGRLIITEPYVDAETHEYCVTAAMPYKDSAGNTKGVIAEDILLKTLVEVAKQINMHGLGYAMLLDSQGVILAHPDGELVSQNILASEKLKDVKPVFSEVLPKENGIIKYSQQGVDSLLVYRKVPSTGWTLAVSVPEKELYQPLRQLQLFFVGLTVLIVLVVIVIALFMARQLTKPVLELNAKAKQIAEGDLTVSAAERGKDEISELAVTFNTMCRGLRNLIRQINFSGANVVTSAGDMHKSAQQTGLVAEQIAKAITEMAKGTVAQADSVQKEVSLIEEMHQSLTTITTEIENSANLAASMRESVVKGNESIQHQTMLMTDSKNAAATVNETVVALSESIQKIGQFVEMIAVIAGQTNLLALNAAIEAARAGTHGRGFAVVAEEVRTLAEQSAESSGEIAKLVAEIQDMMVKVVDAMDNTSRVINNQEVSVNEVKGQFSQIDSSVGMIVSQIKKVMDEAKDINIKAADIEHIINEIAAVAEENSAASQEIAASIESQATDVHLIIEETANLVNEAQKLKKEIQVFQV